MQTLAHSVNAPLLSVALSLGGCDELSSPSSLPPAMEEDSATEQAAFGDVLTRYYWSETDPPKDVAAMIEGLSVGFVGVLGSPVPGRKSFAVPDTYDSYANLELHDVQVFKGAMPEASDKAYVEIPWPNNVDIAELIEATPTGTRVIVLSELARGALEEAQRVESELGIEAVAAVKTNLLMTPPAHGFLVEGVDGKTYAPLLEMPPLICSGMDQLTKFEDALSNIRAAAGQ